MHNWKKRKQLSRKTKNGTETGLGVRQRSFDSHGENVRFDDKTYHYVKPGSVKK